MRILFAPIFWLGRVLLWLVFWPIGLWRSIRHGRKASERRIIEAVQKSQHDSPSQ